MVKPFATGFVHVGLLHFRQLWSKVFRRTSKRRLINPATGSEVMTSRIGLEQWNDSCTNALEQSAIVELFLLLPREDLSALEQMACANGVTVARLLRLLVRGSLSNSTRPSPSE